MILLILPTFLICFCFFVSLIKSKRVIFRFPHLKDCCRCSVCLLDYQPEDRLQQIPACGHTFHMSCIDLWLSSHSTCPLCRLSLLPIAKSSTEISEMQVNEINFHNYVLISLLVFCSSLILKYVMILE